MQVIVIGCGKVGQALATALLERDEDVVLVDHDPRLIAEAEAIDCPKVTGVPIDQDVLKRAGIETADVVCAVTQNDNINIMATQIAQEIFQVDKVITRLYDPRKKNLFQAFGLETFCSTDLTVEEIIRSLDDATIALRHRLHDATITYTTVDVPADLIGSRVSELTGVGGQQIFGLLREGQLQLADLEQKLQDGDRFVLVSLK